MITKEVFGNKNGEVATLVTPFANKEYCFENYLAGIRRLPLKKMCGLFYDNSSDTSFLPACDMNWGFHINQMGHWMVIDWSVICKHWWKREGEVGFNSVLTMDRLPKIMAMGQPPYPGMG